VIDYEHRFIFIHVPRTAGTSILAACGRDWHRDWRVEHASWRIYKEAFPDLWESFAKFAVVRARESHRRSWFYYHKALFAERLDGANYAPYARSYTDWLTLDCPWHEDWSACGIDGSPLNQAAFTGPLEENVYLLRFENLSADWWNLCRALGLPEPWLYLRNLNQAAYRFEK
jgi:hypothetical protein